MRITLYQYAACSTCRKAIKWLRDHEVAHESVSIVDHPPDTALLARIMKIGKLPIRSLFNVSGESYRKGGFKDRLANMSESEALAALAADGKLIKRPLLIGEKIALVGFDEAAYGAKLR